MKKVILSVLALLFAIALVVGGYILLSSRNLQEYVVEEGVSCPYSWQELRDGTYRLAINTTAYPDYSWGVECYPKNVIASAEVSSDSGSVVFSVVPLNMGQAYVQVYCEQTDPFTVRVFEIGMQISVSEDREISVENTEHKDYVGMVTRDEDGVYPIQWWMDPSGVVNLLITGENSGSWEAVDYDLDSIDVTGPFYRQDSCGFEIQGKQAGTFPLIVYNGEAEAIRLEIEVTEDLAAAVTSSTVVPYTIDRSEEHIALESAVGRTVTLLQQAIVSDYFVGSESGSVDFLLNDEEWRWQISANATEEDIAGDIVAQASETKTATVHDMVLTAYSVKDDAVVLWNDGNCMMALYGGNGSTIADALTVAEQIAEENHGQ